MTLKKELVLLSLILSIPVSADTVGHWRFDPDDAETN